MSSSSRSARAPSPPATPILGHARAFRQDPSQFLLDVARTHGPVVRLRVGTQSYHLISDPALVAEVLLERASNYVRDTRSSRGIRLVTGESLLTAEGDTWRRHRRLAQPIFHQQRLKQMAEVMAEAAATTLARWEQAADAGTLLDLGSEMSRLTFTAVGRCLFGVDLGDRAHEVEAAFPVLLEELFHRAQHPATFPIWLPFPRHQRFKAALAKIDRIVAAIIAARRRQDEPGTDLLGLLLSARDETGAGLTDLELRNQVVTFLLAGHETTASTVTWALALLATHPDQQRAVAEEVDRCANTSTGVADQAMRLTRVRAVLQETMRLYPAIWVAERRVVTDDTLGGFSIPANSSVIVSPFVNHRLESYWPEPENFDPERFLRGEAPSLARDGYFPFGAGPHACIGQHFAMLEATVILATLCRRFHVHLDERPMPLPNGGITLRPNATIQVRIERRRSA
ncbi:MAG: cytochrome P450 [Opitutus sp.]